MFVTTFKYRISSTKLRRYLEIQQRAEALYQNQPGHRIVYLRGIDDRCQWLEVHFFSDEQSQRESMQQSQSDPQFTALWQEFKTTLDPTFPAAMEEYRHFASGDRESID